MELNENQKNIYDKLQSQYPKVNKSDVLDFLSGKIDSSAFLEIANPKDLTTQETFLETSGYDTELMKDAVKKIKTDIANDEKLREFDLESALTEYKPSETLLFNSSGIDTKVDLKNSIRAALSLSSNNIADLENNAKSLIVNDLIEQYGEEKVNKFKKQIVVKNKDISFQGYKTNGLIYKIPKELGGDGKYHKANNPGFDTGDFFAISGDLIPIAASIAGGTFGSVGGPIGTIGGSASMGFVGELARLYMGRKLYNFNSDMTPEQFDKFALAQAGKYAAFDAVATAAFLPLAAAVKQIVFTTGKDKLSKDTIEKFINSGGMDKKLKEPLDDARKKIIDLGIAPKDADNYLAIEISKALPRSGIVEKGTVADKLYSRQIKVAENAGNVKEVEKKILKNLTGLKELDNASADKAIKIIDDEAKTLRNIELAQVSDDAAKAFSKIQNEKIKIFKTGSDDIYKDFNIAFSGATNNLEKRISGLAADIDKLTLNKKVNLGPLDLDTITLTSNLLKKYTRKPFKELPPNKIAKLSNAQKSEYYNNKAINDLFKTLGDEVGIDGQLTKLNVIKNGLKGLKETDMSLFDVVQLRTLTKNVDESLASGPVKNVVRKLKGELNTIIDDALSSNPKAYAKIREYDELLLAKRNSFFQDFAQNFGYGTSKRVQGNLQYQGTNIFNKFVSNTPEGYKNSLVLGNLLNNRKVFNANSKLRIKAALYEKYLQEVAPTEIGKSGKMSFAKFKEIYGEQYKNILGKEYDQFFKSPQKIINEYDKIIKNTADIQTTFSKTLPGIDVNVLDAGAPGEIVETIFRLSNKADVGTLVKNLNKQSPEMLTNIRQVYLEKMLKSVRTQNADMGPLFTGLNGRELNLFLNKNRGSILQLFDKKFFDVHRSIANALEVIQSPQAMAAVDSPGLTGAANKAGLFVDIFAGPLNHKRLILNRVARIYDGFDLGGDSLNLLRDYNLFLNAAKKNFMAGNYPKVIDDLLAGGKAERTIADKAIDKVNKFITLGFSKNFGRRKTFDISYRNPLLSKEYLREKLDQDPDIGEATVFEPVDVVAKKVADGLGTTFDATIGKLTKMFLNSQSERRKTEDDREENIYEENVLEENE